MKTLNKTTAALGLGLFAVAGVAVPAQASDPVESGRNLSYTDSNDTAARAMAVLRNLAISIHRLAGHTNGTATLRAYARNPELALVVLC